MEETKKVKFNYQEIVIILFVIYNVLNMVSYQFANLLPAITSMVVILGINLFMFLVNINKISIKKLYLVMVAMLFLIIGMIINNSGFGSLVTMINFYLLFLYGENNKIGKKCVKTVCIIMALGGLAFFLYGASNCGLNTVGLTYFEVSIFLCILIELKRENKKNVLLSIWKLVILIVSGILIYNTEARASLLGLFSFIAFMQIKFLTKNLKIFKILTLIIIIGAIIFPFIYVGMWEAGVEVDMGEGNKRFYSGRQVKLGEALDEFKGKELFGIGSNFRYSAGAKTLNIHNSLFAFWMIYGSLNFIIFLGMFINFIWRMQKNTLNNINRIAIAGLIGMIVVSYYETNLYVNFQYVMLMTLIANLKFEGEKEKNEINNGIYANIQ